MRAKGYSRALAMLLVVVMTITQLPLGAFAFDLRQDSAEVRSGIFTADDGAEYAVLYNDYIALYVNRLDGGFAVLPSTERFDGKKPLSYATFQIDGEAYRYGTYYNGISGAFSIAPQVNEESILESHWQIGDFVVSQIFAITSDALHENSYAVKIGYAAQYFGEGSANIAGRIMLDTQFTPDESVPVMLVDTEDNLVLVDSEAAVRPAPAVAFISKEFIEEANLEAEMDIENDSTVTSGAALKVTDVIYRDMPNKGFIVFNDKNFSSPDSVVFADFNLARETDFEYTPDWDTKLFDGSGADSGLLLFWDEVSVASGNQAAYGTNYGFYDLERGNPRFAPIEKPDDFMSLSEAMTLASTGGTVEAEIYAEYGRLTSTPSEGTYEIVVPDGFTVDGWGTYTGQITDIAEGELFIGLNYGSGGAGEGIPNLYSLRMKWYGGEENGGALEIPNLTIGQRPTLSADQVANLLAAQGDSTSLGISLIVHETTRYQVTYEVIEEGDATVGFMENYYYYSWFEAGDKYEDWKSAVIEVIAEDGFEIESVTAADGSGGAVALTEITEQDNPQWAIQEMPASNVHITITMGTDLPKYAVSTSVTGGAAEVIVNNDISTTQVIEGRTVRISVGDIQIGYEIDTVTAVDADSIGVDLVKGDGNIWTFTMPAKAVTVTVALKESAIPVYPQPINIKAFHGSYDPYSADIATIENALRLAIDGDDVSDEMGVLWAVPGSVVTVDESILTTYTGGSLKVYETGTKNEAATIANNSFTMPDMPVDLVYENNAGFRVFTKVTGNDSEGTATVIVNSANGSSPKPGASVHIYVTNIKDGYEIDSVAASGATLTEQPGGYWTFTMPSNDVTVTVELKSFPIPTYRSVTVKPLVGDGSTLYDVMFWTDNVVGGRKVHQVDNAGRSGQVPVGATVYYALYPTSWNDVPGSLGDMTQWIVSGFTINGVTLSGFDGINTGENGHNNIGYFPYTYNPTSSSTTAGSFTMPDEDVEFEISGYKKDFTYSLALEAYDQYGNRLDWAEKNIRSATAEGGVRDNWTTLPDGSLVSSVSGIGQFPINKQTAVMIQRSIYDYTLGKVELVINPGNEEWERTIPEAKHEINGNFSTYFYNSTWPYSGVIRVYYKNTARTLTITGAAMDDDNVLSQGEVMVMAGDSYGMAGRDTRSIEIAPMNDKFETLVTLTWSEYVKGKSSYTIHSLPTGNLGNCKVEHVRSGSEGSSSFAVYKVTLSGNASITIQSTEVARDISFSSYFEANSPNSGTFRTVALTAGEHTGRIYVGDELTEGRWIDKIGDIINADVAPQITKIVLSGDKGYSKSVTGTDVYNGYKSAFTFSEDGQYMTLDLRTLFGIAEDFVFEEDSYTLTIDYTYGEGHKRTGSKTYKFDLSPNSFRPGELTHIAIVKASRYNAPWRSERPDVEINNWVAVPGVSYDNMVEKALTYNESGHFLYFVCEDGFESNGSYNLSGPYYGKHDFIAREKSVLLNGHGLYSPMYSFSAFMIDENEDGSISIISTNMSFTSSYLPLFVPAPYTNSVKALELKLEKNKNYDILEELPSYDEIRKQHATNEEAKEAWMEAVEEARESMLALSILYPDPVWEGANDPEQAFLAAELGGNGLSVSIGGFEGGVTIDVKDIFILKEGFEVGGRLNVQMPGTAHPIIRLEVVSLTTESGDKFMPVGDIWAEGEGRVQLPSALGGYGGAAYGVFNTYTDEYGFEGEINFYFIELSGSFYLAKTSYGFPMLDEFIVSFGVNDLPVGLGFPPAPAQIIEIQGFTVGVANLADTISYNPLKNTIPSVRVILGAEFALVEIIGFGGEMWLELLSGGVSVSGGVGIGPANLDLIKELSVGYGVRDGVYTPYGNADDYIIKGKRSLTFFFNFKFHASLFFADGSGAFGISMNISPALWEKKGGFQNLTELAEFVSLNLSAWGWMSLSILELSDDWSLYNAEISVDISFKTGKDFRVMPFGFRTFEFIAKEKIMGFDAGQSRVNVLAYYNALETWLINRVKEKKAKLEKQQGRALSFAETAELQMTLLNEALAEPARYGLAPDTNYQGEYTSFLEDVAADSEIHTVSSAAARGIATMSITQDTANIKVDYNGSVYTHSVTVPDNESRYILRLEGYGGEPLTFSDIQAFKPNGQALTISGVQGSTEATLAESAYNAVIRNGEMLLSLADYRNSGDDKSVTGVDGTLSGVWQIVSGRPFKSQLIKISAPSVKTVALKDDGVLTAEFENLDDTTSGGYYYSLTLERKGDPTAEPQETVTLLKDMPVPQSGNVSLDLENMLNQANINDNDLKFNVNDLLASGDWYARVTLRQGEQEDVTVADENGTNQTITMLNTRYIDDKISVSPYKVANTLLSSEIWTANLQAVPGGNQSIDVSFDPATAVSDELTVAGYHIAVYDENGMPASRVITETDENGNGVQKVEPMEFDFLAGELAEGETSYSYNIPNVPVGEYTVGVSPLYADLIPKTGDNGDVIAGEYTASAATRKGKEEESSSVTIAQANPPALSLNVTGGNLTERNGARIIFAGPDAELTATTTQSATVTYYTFDGTQISASSTLADLASYSGQMLMITAANANGDFTAEYVTVYAGANAPTLLPDNYDTASGEFVFTAYKDTGKYTVTGQTESGAVVGGVVADASGRFELSGTLNVGVDTDTIALSVSNEAGIVTMREVRIVRGTQNAPVVPPSGGGSSGSGSYTNPTLPAGDGTVSVGYTKSGGTVTLNLPDSKINEIIRKSQNNTAIFDLTKIAGATDVVLSKTALKKLADAGLDVEFRLPGGTVALDAGAASSAAAQANGANITVSLKAISRSNLTETQRAAVETGDLVFEVSVFSDTQQIHSFDGTITVSVPYSVKTPVAVWYLNDAGQLEKVDCVYDATAKMVRFTVNHLSLYIIRADAVAAKWVNPFTDVRASDWFYEYVEYVFTRGFMTGTSIEPMLFSPGMPTTRGMIVTVLYRYAGSPNMSSFDNPFNDVDEAKWYTDAVKWAAANGIVSGYGNGRFGPEDNITRQDLAVILNNFAKRNGWPLPVKRDYQNWIDEADIANYAKEAIEAFFKANVINGKPGNLFDPKGEATRAELAAMLTRFLEAVKEE